jgi:hypothetical protein
MEGGMWLKKEVSTKAIFGQLIRPPTKRFLQGDEEPV